MCIIYTIILPAILATMIFSGEVSAKKRAVIIGISEYPNANSLVGPVVDAKNMSKLLVDSLGYQADEIKLLTDGLATRNGILKTMREWLVEDTRPGDDVLFYYSGHGFQVEDENGDEYDHKDEAIAPYDVDVGERNEFINMITDDEISGILDEIQGAEVTVIVDSCYSGTMTRGLFSGGGGDGQYAKTLQPVARSRGISAGAVDAHRKEESFIGGSESRVVWTAVSSWQKALVDFETGVGSVFTNLFIEGIREKKADKNGDASITRSELLDYLRTGSNEFCDRNIKQCKTGLTPTLETTKDLFVEDILGEGVSVASLSNEQYFDQAVAIDDSSTVSVQVLPGNTLKAGQSVQVLVNSQFDGYLMIFDVRDDGQVIQLYPTEFASKEHQNGKIQKERAMTVPGEGYGFRYEAFDPGSAGRIYAIVSEDKLPENVIPQEGLVVENPKQYMNDLATSLRQVWSEDLINRQINWSAGKADYRVVR